MLYCYFISRWSAEIEEVPYRTLHAAPIEFLRQDDLMAAVRSIASASPSMLPLLLEHNAVLASASRHATILPLPFGSTFRGGQGLTGLLAARQAELLAALDRLAGKAEMRLHVTLDAGEDGRERAAGIARACRVLDGWFEVRQSPAGGVVLELAHLIERSEAEQHVKMLAPYATEVSGPLPPFHFLPRFLRMPVRAEGRGGRPRAASVGGAA
jgi:Gas vesicle synthesis protein GvpL/GvpF